MEETPGTTDTVKKRIARIAQGNLGSEEVSQLLNETFDGEGYLTALHDYPKPQRYIDGLYEVWCLYLVNIPFP